MLVNTTKKDIRTLGYVLRRTNYGEADRILNIITPVGKIAAIAKGSRREKSKLAGGIEIFSLVDFNFHYGKSSFAIVTGARMIKHLGNIIKDYNRMELATTIMKKIDNAAEHSDNSEYFKIMDQCLKALDSGIDNDLIEIWFILNYKKALGEELNIYRDNNGKLLSAEKAYFWNNEEVSFVETKEGDFGVDELKVLRLMLSSDIGFIRRVRIDNDTMMKVLNLVRTVV